MRSNYLVYVLSSTDLHYERKKTWDYAVKVCFVVEEARLKRQLLIGMKRHNVISSVRLKGFGLSASFTRSSTANTT